MNPNGFKSHQARCIGFYDKYCCNFYDALHDCCHLLTGSPDPDVLQAGDYSTCYQRYVFEEFESRIWLEDLYQDVPF